MAQRHFSQSMSDWADVMDLMLEFQRENKVVLEVRLMTSPVGNKPELFLVMEMTGKVTGSEEVKRLGYTRLKCSALNKSSLLGVVIHALYQMDFQLAEEELGEAPRPEA